MDVSISASSLHQSLGDFPPPLIIDVRRQTASDPVLPHSVRRNPDQVVDWAAGLEIGRAITVYCARGREASPVAAAVPAPRSFVAQFLAGDYFLGMLQ
jgi:rhodanese-related sulfurtransferase